MSEIHRDNADDALVRVAASEADRDAKIEQLLLVGLDHYFAARYEAAINVWTRALFFDRSHPRARAYIERARSALAERQRQSEELLHAGVAAFHRGEGDEARRLLKAAIEGGAPSEEALALLERLDRLETTSRPSVESRRERQAKSVGAAKARSRSKLGFAATLMIVAVILAMGAYAATSDGAAALWKSWLALQTVPDSAAAPPPVVPEQSLALPRRGEMALT